MLRCDSKESYKKKCLFVNALCARKRWKQVTWFQVCAARAIVGVIMIGKLERRLLRNGVVIEFISMDSGERL